MPLDNMVIIPLEQIQATQSDDFLYPDTDVPIQVFRDQGRFLIKDGNHRYYRKLEAYGSHISIKVEIVENPYLVR